MFINHVELWGIILSGYLPEHLTFSLKLFYFNFLKFCSYSMKILNWTHSLPSFFKKNKQQNKTEKNEHPNPIDPHVALFSPKIYYWLTKTHCMAKKTHYNLTYNLAVVNPVINYSVTFISCWHFFSVFSFQLFPIIFQRWVSQFGQNRNCCQVQLQLYNSPRRTRVLRDCENV